jgi:hypothetical protein
LGTEARWTAWPRLPCRDSGRIPSIELPPDVAKNSRPKLPNDSADTCVARLVGRTGKLCRAMVIDTVNGTRSMSSAALRAIESWTSEAPTLRGQPVESV